MYNLMISLPNYHTATMLQVLEVRKYIVWESRAFAAGEEPLRTIQHCRLLEDILPRTLFVLLTIYI